MIKLHIAGLLLLSAALSAETRFYQGAWRIESYAWAPWGQPFAGAARLVGQSVVFKPGSIAGPNLLACRSPRYSVRTVPAEGLFQGMLGDGAAAAKLGIRGSAFQTLATGCEHAIDYHFTGAGTAVFALDNAIYFLRKTR